jgi:aryl-alcohol dehydrogenase-like predicted oxidoreductase
LHRAVESGVTLFDAADVYGAGHSERLLCSVLAAHPEVLVATKFGNTSTRPCRQNGASCGTRMWYSPAFWR